MLSKRQENRVRAKQLADDKMRESGQWWEAFDLAVASCRRYASLFLSTRCLVDRQLAAGLLDHEAWLTGRRQLEWAHDMMLAQHDNIQVCATCATSAEIAARIYYEEYEERENGQN